MTIIERLQQFMKTNKLKLTEVAAQTGIPYPRMHKWISGTNQPKGEDYKILDDYMNGRPSNILKGDSSIYGINKTPSSNSECMQTLQKAMEVILSQQKTIENLLASRGFETAASA